MMARTMACISAICMSVLGVTVASGQQYPARPVRLITSIVGSSSDFAARVIAQSLTSALGQSVIVDNRAIAGIESAANAAPDGYTLLVYGSPLWITPLFENGSSWNVWRDFSPIVLAIVSPNILVVHPSVGVKTVVELIALARAKPGELNYGSGPPGSTTHLAVELFNTMAGVNIVRIPYKGVGQALGDLIAGQVQVMMPNTAAAMVHVNSGRLRGIAVGSAEPSELAPGLPTVSASGVPGYQSVAMSGVFAPAKTPARIVVQLNREIARILGRPDIREIFFKAGGEAAGGSPDDFAKRIKVEIAQLGKVIAERGIRGK